MSKRLNQILSYIEPGKKLADIGSDHAQIPIAAVRDKQVPFAIAGEVAEGPYQRSLEAVNQAGLMDQIHVRLGDGLEVIEPDDGIDQVVIAGMGGLLIQSILTRALGQNIPKKGMTFILQANKDVPDLREFLLGHDFKIKDEDVVYEGGFYYEILICDYGIKEEEAWSNQEIYLGRHGILNNKNIYLKMLEERYNKNKQILGHLKNAKGSQAKAKELNRYQEMIEEVWNG